VKEMKTLNGRPSNLGTMYFKRYENGGYIRKYCVGYCPNCKTKIGLTSQEIKEFVDNTSGGFSSFISRLVHTKIIIP